jgi:hypothetical protein
MSSWDERIPVDDESGIATNDYAKIENLNDRVACEAYIIPTPV